MALYFQLGKRLQDDGRDEEKLLLRLQGEAMEIKTVQE
jgi:hypothetical protein